MKAIHWYPPLQLSASEVVVKGVKERRLRRNLLSKIWNDIKCYFIEEYIVGQETRELYNYYLEPKKDGQLGIAIPPKLKDDEILITLTALSIHQINSNNN